MFDKITLIFHHGGQLSPGKVVTYYGGIIKKIPKADPDLLSVIVFADLVRDLGYVSYDTLWFKDPRADPTSSLTKISSDEDVRFFIGAIKGFEAVHLYVSHDIEFHDPRDEYQMNKNDVDRNEAPVGLTDSEDDVVNLERWNDKIFNSSDDERWPAEANGKNMNLDDVDLQRNFEKGGSSTLGRQDQMMVAHSSIGLDDDWDALSSESEDFHSIHGSDDDELPIFGPTFRMPSDRRDIKFHIGQLFPSLEKFKETVDEYAIHEYRSIRFVKNDNKRVRARCAEGCDWLVLASLLPDGFTAQVKTYRDKHTCTRSYRNKRMSAKWVAKNVIGTVRAHPEVHASTLQAVVNERWGLGISKSKAVRSRRLAKRMVEGDYFAQYSRVRDYSLEILRSNVGSTCIVQSVIPPDAENIATSGVIEQPMNRFQRIYMCLAASKKGFVDGCRPLIGLDGCHLRGPCGGILLAAVGVDPNNQLFPIAVAVCEGENKDSWIWFLERLQADVGYQQDKHWTVISDQQKGLLPALQLTMPGVDQRFCVRHLYSNFRKLHPGLLLRNIMWDAARATYGRAFEAAMKKIQDLDKKAWEWLAKNDSSLWSRSGFRSYPKCDILLNNICESFNAMILDARSKPIITLMDSVRELLMFRYQRNRERAEKWKGKLCPSVVKKIEKMKQQVREWIVKYAGDDEFEVQGFQFHHRYTVKLGMRTCSCRRWEISGIPCIHTIVAIFFKGEDVENYVDDCYHISTYNKCYANIVHPVNGEDMWPRSTAPRLMPPTYKRAPGRPKKLRRKDPVEAIDTGKLSKKNQQQKCGKCKSFGHNTRSCSQPGLSQREQHGPPKKRGRPRKDKGVSSSTTNPCEGNPMNF